jgi:hypothetical protein
MNYWTDLFSPATFLAFSQSDRSVTGFRTSQRSMAVKIQPGDLFLPYLMKFSRWIGILEVIEGPFEDSKPVFLPADDPFSIRFRIRPVLWLEQDYAVPIDLPELWDVLSFTKGRSKSDYWLGPLRRSMQHISPEDAKTIIDQLKRQEKERIRRNVDPDAWDSAIATTVRRGDKVVELTIPPPEVEENESAPTPGASTAADVRESHQIQATLGIIGDAMGFKIWYPPHDRAAIIEHIPKIKDALLTTLPIGFDTFTMSTVQAIDVLWIKGRSIVRAFEVEHTTSIYSGLLRMADLLALQPNLQINLHIVGPIERKRKFFSEVKRPVFSFLDPNPLKNVCTFLSYDTIRELAQLETLRFTSPNYLDELIEEEE